MEAVLNNWSPVTSAQLAPPKSPTTASSMGALLTNALPRWFSQFARRCAYLTQLAPNWDSYGGLPVHPTVAEAAVRLVQSIAGPGMPQPKVVPTPKGGLQLEWHTGDVDLEVELVSPTRLNVVFESRTGGEEWERELTWDLGPLAQALDAVMSSS